MDKFKLICKIKEKINSPIYIWGAGFAGTEAYRELTANSIRISGFVDNFLTCPLQEDIRHIPVIRPHSVSLDAYIVIAARASICAIIFELMELGFMREQYVVWQMENVSAHSYNANDRLLTDEVFFKTECRSLPNGVLALETSDRCNLLCVMCGYQKRCLYYGTHKGKEPPFDCRPVLPILNTVKSLVLNIAGEPLFNGALWDVLDPLKESGYGNLESIQFHTNGQLLDRYDTIERLAALPIPLTISVSVDAVNAETYRKIRGANFDHLMQNIRKMLDVFQKTGRTRDNLQINATLFRENVEQFPEFICMAHKLGFKSVITRPMSYRYDMDFAFARSNRNNFDFDYDQQALQYYPQLTRRILEDAKSVAEKLGINLYIDGAFEVSVFSGEDDLPYPISVGEFWHIIGDRKAREAKKMPTELSLKSDDRIPMKRRCYRPWTDVSVQKDGGVCMCLWLAGKLIGNINETPFDKVWNSETAQKIRQDMIDGYLPDMCEKTVCRYRQESVKAYLEARRSIGKPKMASK